MPKGTQTRIKYNGEYRTLSILAKEHGVELKPLYARWNRKGRPQTLTDELLFGKTPRKKRESKGPKKEAFKYTLMPDGTAHTAWRLHKMFGVSPDTFSYRRRKHGKTEFERSEIEKMVEKSTRTKVILKKTQSAAWPQDDEKTVAYEPTLMERALGRL